MSARMVNKIHDVIRMELMLSLRIVGHTKKQIIPTPICAITLIIGTKRTPEKNANAAGNCCL